jgi:hypothetical protein
MRHHCCDRLRSLLARHDQLNTQWQAGSIAFCDVEVFCAEPGPYVCVRADRFEIGTQSTYLLLSTFLIAAGGTQMNQTS